MESSLALEVQWRLSQQAMLPPRVLDLLMHDNGRATEKSVKKKNILGLSCRLTNGPLFPVEGTFVETLLWTSHIWNLWSNHHLGFISYKMLIKLNKVNDVTEIVWIGSSSFALNSSLSKALYAFFPVIPKARLFVSGIWFKGQIKPSAFDML